MKILLFGATGLLGTSIQSTCINKGIECIGLGEKDLDIARPSDLENAIKSHNPDVVINSAALQAIDKCEKCPREAFDVNSTAVCNLAKICEKKDITLVQLSTQGVFDGTKDDYYTEDDCPNPINIYGVSKYAGECFARNLCNRHYIIRLPTMFGSRKEGYPGFIDKVLKWIGEGKELNIADDKIDSFSYTLDVAVALINIISEKLPFGVYHIANFGKPTYYDVVSKIIGLLQVDIKVSKARDSDFPAAGKKPLKVPIKSIKLNPLRSWEDALSAYIINEVKR